MGITLNELKAKYAAQQTATTATTVETASTASTVSSSRGPGVMPGLFGLGFKKVKEVTVATAVATRKVLPVTTGRFEDIVAGLNDKHNGHDREIFKNKIRAHMIAQSVGVTLPGDEELDTLYEAYIAEQAQVEEEVAQVEEEVVQVEVQEKEEATPPAPKKEKAKKESKKEEPKKEEPKKSTGRRKLPVRNA